jgi:hypothetical protein
MVWSGIEVRSLREKDRDMGEDEAEAGWLASYPFQPKAVLGKDLQRTEDSDVWRFGANG